MQNRIEIRRGLPSDFPRITDLVAWSFRTHTPAHLRFEDFDPATVNPSPEAMGYWRIAFLDGEMAGGLVLVPRRLRLGGAEFEYGCIGHVHCYPKYRHAGIFQSLMNRAIADMDAAGIPLSYLSGDRLRYGNYGWEHGGTYRMLCLEPALMRFSKWNPEPSVLDFREYLGDEKDTLRIKAARESAASAPLHDTAEEVRQLFIKPGRVTYLYDTDGSFAYAVLSNRDILEYGGDVDGVEKIVRCVLQTGPINAYLPPPECNGPLERMLDQYAQYFKNDKTQMVRINDLVKTLQAFTPWLEERLQGWEGRIVIAGEGTEHAAIAGDGSHVNVTRTDDEPDLAVSRRKLVSLLFGACLPDEVAHDRNQFWRRAFPLPITWPPMEHC